jgi:hypothetical protein
MSPLDKHGYVMTESAPDGRYRLILGFENLGDLHAAHDFVIKSRLKKCKSCGWTDDTHNPECPRMGEHLE